MFFSATLFPLALALSAAASHDGHLANRHHAVAKRVNGDVGNLTKRYDSARWTFYDVGLGACGDTNVESDFIVALNSNQYGGGYPGPECFKTITMTYNGKTTTATIMDECPGCPYGGLDLSRGLFDFFASEDEGVIYGTWSYGDSGSGGGEETTTSTKQAKPTTSTSEWVEPTTSSTSEWVPPTTSTTPKATKTKTKTSTSTWVEPSTSSVWSSSAAPSSSAWSSSAAPSSWSSIVPSSSSVDSSSSAVASATAAGTANNGPHVLETINEAIINLAGVAVQAQAVL